MFPDTQISPGGQNHSWLRTATMVKGDWAQDKKRHKKRAQHNEANYKQSEKVAFRMGGNNNT